MRPYAVAWTAREDLLHYEGREAGAAWKRALIEGLEGLEIGVG
jgi:hypothetical protein